MNSSHFIPDPSDGLRGIVPFDVEGRPMRFGVTEDGTPFVVATDFAKLLDYRDASNALRLVDDDEKGTQIVSTPGGQQELRVLYEDGIWELIFLSRKIEAKAIKARVKAILREIRRTGRYEAPLDDPLAEIERQTQLTARAIEIARRERAHREAAEQKARQLEPAATAWERLASTNGDFSVRIAANILNRDPNIHTGQNRLFAFIRGMRMVDHGDVPYSSHSQHLRLKPGDAYTDRRTGETKIGDPKLRVTVRGLQYLHKRLGGVVPISYHVQAELTQDGEQDAA